MSVAVATVGRRPTAPLSRHVVARTEDVNQALCDGSKLVTPHTLRPHSGERFGWAFHAVEIGDSLLAFHSYRSAVEVVTTSPVDYFFAMVLLRGAVQVSTEHG